jgi:hypothetical protein
MTNRTERDTRLNDLIAELRVLPEARPVALARLRAALSEAAPKPAPFRLVLSPLRAAVLAASLVAITSAGWYLASRAIPVNKQRAVPVQFVFVHAGAARVSLVGDFNDWDPAATPLTRGQGGMWSAVIPLQPGRVAYSFVVDERSWHADPNAAVKTSDFGRPSSVLFVSSTASTP